mmetsp:Transcript_27990/g.80908  ORF Transcript_27990/g.80908 Transcript_27990/m.80908 type:complete len:89 (+) Transcript_27990:118-384(+)
MFSNFHPPSTGTIIKRVKNEFTISHPAIQVAAERGTDRKKRESVIDGFLVERIIIDRFKFAFAVSSKKNFCLHAYFKLGVVRGTPTPP